VALVELQDATLCRIHILRGAKYMPVAPAPGEPLEYLAHWCDTCDGTGECSSCDGDGEHECERCDDTHECKACDGTGDCPECTAADDTHTSRRFRKRNPTEQRERDYLAWAFDPGVRPYTVDDLIEWTNGGGPSWASA
jgi:hypothetical protein